MPRSRAAIAMALDHRGLLFKQLQGGQDLLGPGRGWARTSIGDGWNFPWAADMTRGW